MKKSTTKSKNLPTQQANSKAVNQGIQQVGALATKPIDGTLSTFKGAITKAKQLISDGMQQLTTLVAMPALQPVQLKEVFDYSKGIEDAIKEAAKLARARVLDAALRTGTPAGNGGNSRKLFYPDGTYTLAKATKTGTDPAKFEAALRARNAQVNKYMVQVISYKLASDFDGVKQAIDDGIFTADEATLFTYEPSYAVERSKEGREEES